MARKNKLVAMFSMKCPRCHQGNLYNAPITEGIYKMNKECPVCHQAFELEPGFYWGAMYVGYGFSAGYMLTTVTALIVGLGWSVNAAFGLAIFGGIFLFPFIARVSRAVWIHIYVGYDKSLDQKVNKEEPKIVKAVMKDQH